MIYHTTSTNGTRRFTLWNNAERPRLSKKIQVPREWLVELIEKRSVMSSVVQKSVLLRLGALTLLLGLTSSVPRALWAQGNNRVSGLITDQSGAVIVGATVTARDVGTNVVTTTTSNDRGYYLLLLPIGTYDIKAS